MQEALLQGCRRSARLLKRASDATVGLPQTATRALHNNAGEAAAADTTAEGSKRRRRRAVATAKDASPQHTQKEQQQTEPATGAGTEQLQALGSITNRADVLGTLDIAAAGAAAAAAAPPAKRPRGRPPRAAVSTTATPAAANVPSTSAHASAGAGAGSRNQSAPAGASTDATAPALAPPAAAGKGMQAAAGSRGKAASKISSGPTRAAEQRLWSQGFRAVAGVDEAGRGPLAGPVVAATAVLPPGVEFELLNDSKQMSEADRETVYEQLTSHPDVSYAVAVVDAATIDRINILQAAMLAMRTAVEGLAGAGLQADHLLIDGNRKPSGLDDTPTQLVVKGDASVTCIAAASVLAKVTRDRMMEELDRQYPQYGFGQHKGYGVPAHKAAIQQHGPCPVHRRSFEPIKSLTKWPGYPKPPGAAAGTVTLARCARGAGSGAAGVKPPAIG